MNLQQISDDKRNIGLLIRHIQARPRDGVRATDH